LLKEYAALKGCPTTRGDEGFPLIIQGKIKGGGSKIREER